MIGDTAFDFSADQQSASRSVPSSNGVGVEPASAPTMAPSVRYDSAAARGAGVALVFAAVGAGVGALFGGPWGLGAGILLVGALRNAARAKRLWDSAEATDREEAAKSATMGAVGVAAGGYLAYRAYRKDNDE